MGSTTQLHQDRSLHKRNPNGVVGIISITPDNAFTRPVIAGIKDILEDYQTEQIPGNTNLERKGQLPPGLVGVIAIAHEASDNLLGQIYERGIPLALISHQVPGLPVPSVIPNNIQGIARLVEHIVVACGRRQPAFLGGLPTQVDALQREEAFCNELLRYSIVVPASYYLQGDFLPDVAARVVKDLIKSGTSFDALICADHIMGLSALNVLKTMDIDVPDQVAVAAFDDSPEAAAAGLTTVAAELAELGRCAARQIVAQLNGIPIRGVTTLGLQLNIRRSTQPEVDG